MILTNASIVTFDAELPEADTVMVRDGRISFVGRRRDVRLEPDTLVHDIGGATIVPGLIDAHTHPTQVARSLWHIHLPGFDDVDDLLDFVRDIRTRSPD